MPDTGERREITGRVNAKEAEVVQQSKKLASRTNQLSAKMDAKNRQRKDEAKGEAMKRKSHGSLGSEALPGSTGVPSNSDVYWSERKT